ncbi:hypothetical protein EV44_g3960 [Erysiphe necator]|uniref:Uncharacterized protein n=1 Tax=Uncinula necator TaxID=52586 RepID=A0A0B1PG35_UNCNE|nr:hypothetical protein EV44_g3960 [Erysiphe necator]
MSITLKTVPVEAHWSIDLVERYHALLKCSFQIISEELKDLKTGKDVILQMAIKAINDSAGPNGLIPTLQVFGAYPRMCHSDPPNPSIAQRATAIQKAMNEIKKINCKHLVNNALNQRNGLRTEDIHDLSLNSEVLVWREAKVGKAGRWDGPFKLISIENETCKLAPLSGPTDFRSTLVKPYYRDIRNYDNENNNNDNDSNNHSHYNDNDNDNTDININNSNDFNDSNNICNDRTLESTTQNNIETPLRQNLPRNRELPTRFRIPNVAML